MSKEPPVKPKLQSNVSFLHLDKYLGRPAMLGGGGGEGGGNELDKAQARDMKAKEQQMRKLLMKSSRDICRKPRDIPKCR